MTDRGTHATLLRRRYETTKRAEANQIWLRYVKEFGRLLGGRVSEELLYWEQVEMDAYRMDKERS